MQMNEQIQLQQLSDTALLNLVLAPQDNNKQQIQVIDRTWRWHQQNWRNLAKSSHWDLLEIYGLDQQMAWRILGLFEICKRYQSAEIKKRRSIKTSKDVYDLLQIQLADLDHEQFFCALPQLFQ